MRSFQMLRQTLLLGMLTVFAASQVACGQIEVPMTLALDSSQSSISLSLQPAGLPLGTTELEGGVSTLMTMDIGLIEILFHLPFSGIIEVTDLLFGGTSINILGTPTGTLCTIVDESAPGGGTVLVDIFDGMIDFDMVLGTAILPTNPAILALIPDGFAFEFAFSDSAELSLVDLLGLAFGNADGGLALTQTFSDVIEVIVLGNPLQIGIDGQVTLATANEFPSGLLLDECDAFLSAP
jgi:hypothetical protein